MRKGEKKEERENERKNKQTKNKETKIKSFIAFALQQSPSIFYRC
jgi:hypothetical protein